MRKNFLKKAIIAFFCLGILYLFSGEIYNSLAKETIQIREQYLIDIADSLGNVDESVELRAVVMKKLFNRSFVRYYKNSQPIEGIMRDFEKRMMKNGYNITVGEGVRGEKNGMIVIINKTKDGFYILVKYDDIFDKLNL